MTDRPDDPRDRYAVRSWVRVVTCVSCDEDITRTRAGGYIISMGEAGTAVDDHERARHGAPAPEEGRHELG